MAMLGERVRALNAKPLPEKPEYVLYWAQMNRRVGTNHALAYAIELANEQELPVLFYEGLTCAYPHANDRLHTFILEGVPDNRRDAHKAGLGYAFYLRRRHADANNAVYRLAERAAAVVTDDYPTFIAARHNASVPEKIGVPYYAVDSSCVVPMHKLQRREYAAYTIRPKIHKLLPDYLRPFEMPKAKRKFTAGLPSFHLDVNRDEIAKLVASCEIDHSIRPSTAFEGGRERALQRLRHFLHYNARRYARERNEPSERATSNLSPYLHFGFISSLEVALAAREYAREHKIVVDEFLEELIVRRELAFNYAAHEPNYGKLESLPDWARQTLAKHDKDKRDPQYTREQLEAAETSDPLWNATQKEMLLRGKIHGYYRMYWAKKIIEWMSSHQEALDFLLYLHDRYALDGRDANTYTNVLWCFGLHDRAWGERPIFGSIRYMSYEGMKRKTDTAAYLLEMEDLERGGADPLRLPGK